MEGPKSWTCDDCDNENQYAEDPEECSCCGTKNPNWPLGNAGQQPST